MMSYHIEKNCVDSEQGDTAGTHQQPPSIIGYNNEMFLPVTLSLAYYSARNSYEIRNQKKLAVIVEFPYIFKGSGSISEIVQDLWDEVLNTEEIMLVIWGRICEKLLCIIRCLNIMLW